MWAQLANLYNKLKVCDIVIAPECIRYIRVARQCISCHRRPHSLATNSIAIVVVLEDWFLKYKYVFKIEFTTFRLAWSDNAFMHLSYVVSLRLIVKFTFNKLYNNMITRQVSLHVSSYPLLLTTEVALRSFSWAKSLRTTFRLRPCQDFWGYGMTLFLISSL